MNSAIDWHSLFVPSLNVGEIVLRGTLVYLFLFFLLRLLRREAGHIGISDLLVVVLIADAAQNAMGSEYRSLTEGAILVATIALWDYFLDWLSFRVAAVRRLLRPAPPPSDQERSPAAAEHEARKDPGRGTDGAAAGKGSSQRGGGARNAIWKEMAASA